MCYNGTLSVLQWYLNQSIEQVKCACVHAFTLAFVLAHMYVCVHVFADAQPKRICSGAHPLKHVCINPCIDACMNCIPETCILLPIDACIDACMNCIQPFFRSYRRTQGARTQGARAREIFAGRAIVASPWSRSRRCRSRMGDG